MSIRTLAPLCALLILPVFSACGSPDTSDALCETLLSPYEADVRFILTAEGEAIEGTMHVEKSDTLLLDIRSPEPYTGIRVECGSAGEGTTYSLEYGGVSVEVPRERLFRFGVLTALFEDTLANSIDALPERAFTDADGTFSLDVPYALHPCGVTFEEGGGTYTIVCDRDTGIPLTAAYTADGISVWVQTETFGKLKAADENTKQKGSDTTT